MTLIPETRASSRVFLFRYRPETNAPHPDKTHYNREGEPTRNTSCPQTGTAYIGRCPPWMKTHALTFKADTTAGSQKQWTTLAASNFVVLCPSDGGFSQIAAMYTPSTLRKERIPTRPIRWPLLWRVTRRGVLRSRAKKNVMNCR